MFALTSHFYDLIIIIVISLFQNKRMEKQVETCGKLVETSGKMWKQVETGEYKWKKQSGISA